jgi:hypothetical protein
VIVTSLGELIIETKFKENMDQTNQLQIKLENQENVSGCLSFYHFDFIILC